LRNRYGRESVVENWLNGLLSTEAFLAAFSQDLGVPRDLYKERVAERVEGLRY
jgi:hypothetical protein